MMNNEITIFENPEFGKIRTFVIDEEPWLVGKDVCLFFGDSNHNRTLSRLDEQDKRIIEIKDSLGRNQNIIAINESGLYALLFAMQPQKANKDGGHHAYPIEIQQRIEKIKRFKRWITHDVLPSIRKHGLYAADELLNNPDLMIRIITELKEEREMRKLAQAETVRLEKENAKMLPKVQFADAVSASKTSILVGEMAKILKQNGVDMGQNRFFDWLRGNGYLMQNGSSKNLPTQKSMEMGLFEIKESTQVLSDGSVRINKTPKILPKGQIYFVDKFLGKK